MTVHEKLAPQSSTPSTEVPSDVAEIAPERPTPGELEELGEPYRPYRTVVAWYCWRAADTQL